MLFGPRNPGPAAPHHPSFPVELVAPPGPWVAGSGRNLTLRGVEVEVPEPFALAAEVGFRFQAWGGRLEGRATVARFSAAEEGRYLLALEFAPGMSAAETEKLARFLASRPPRG